MYKQRDYERRQNPALHCVLGKYFKHWVTTKFLLAWCFQVLTKLSHCLYSASTCRAHLLADWEISSSLRLHWFSSPTFWIRFLSTGTGCESQLPSLQPYREHVSTTSLAHWLPGEWRHSAFLNSLYFPRKRLKLNASALKNLWKWLKKKGSTSMKQTEFHLQK